MKIVINNTDHAIYADGKLLIPGTNVLDKIGSDKPDVKAFVKNGDLEIKDSDKLSDADKAKAVDNVTSHDTLDKLKDAVPGIDASKAEKTLKKFDDQIKKMQG